jgi:hypothetical protein
MPNETKRIRRIRRIDSGYLNKNSFPNTVNEMKRCRRMSRMKLRALGVGWSRKWLFLLTRNS